LIVGEIIQTIRIRRIARNTQLGDVISAGSRRGGTDVRQGLRVQPTRQPNAENLQNDAAKDDVHFKLIT